MKSALGIVVLVFGLAACGTPESRCQEGVADLTQRLSALLGSDQAANADVVEAQAKVDMATAQLATGNHEACENSLEEARVALNRSQRTNQQ